MIATVIDYVRRVYQAALPESIREPIYLFRKFVYRTAVRAFASSGNSSLDNLRSVIREQRETFARQRATIRNIRSRIVVDSEIRRNSWLAANLYNREKFSYAVNKLVDEHSLQNTDVILAHDFLSLLPAIRLKESRLPTATLIFDNVEAPLQQHRTSSVIADYFINSPIDQLLANDEVVRLLQACDVVFGTSPTHMSFFETHKIPNAKLIPQLPYFEELTGSSTIRKDADSISDGSRLILYLNNVYRDAGAEECVAAMEKLPDNYRLAILGRIDDPDAKQTITTLRKNPKIGNKVVILDLVPPGDVINYISGSDCIAIPLKPNHVGYKHLWPNRIFQAFAARCPVLVPAQTAIGDLVQKHGNGSVFKSFSPDDIASSMKKCCQMRYDQKFEQKAESIARQYVWEENERRIDEILQRVAGKDNLKVLLLAGKRIHLNHRVKAFIKTLIKSGHQVDVIAYCEPDESIRVPGATYHVPPSFAT